MSGMVDVIVKHGNVTMSHIKSTPTDFLPAFYFAWCNMGMSDPDHHNYGVKRRDKKAERYLWMVRCIPTQPLLIPLCFSVSSVGLLY